MDGAGLLDNTVRQACLPMQSGRESRPPAPQAGTNVLFSALNGSSITTNFAYPEAHFVYVLLSLKDRNLYIGFSKNIVQRFKEHQRGKVRVTKYRRPFVPIVRGVFPEL